MYIITTCAVYSRARFISLLTSPPARSFQGCGLFEGRELFEEIRYYIFDSTAYGLSLCCMAWIQGGERTARRGYWGDIVNSPYISFGIESENKELLKPSASAMPANVSIRVCT